MTPASGRDPHLTIRGIHHGVVGAVMFLVGLFIVLESPLRDLRFIVPAGSAGFIGLLLALDDLIQHIIQHWKKGFRSPVNKLYRKIGRGLGLFSVLVLALLLSCTDSRPPLEGVRFSAGDTTARARPIVFWGHAPVDTTLDCSGESACYHIPVNWAYNSAGRFILEAPSHRFFLAAGEVSDSIIQIYRLEWAPAGDSCFSPIGYGIIERARGAALLNFTVYGLELEDQLILWRSQPWPGYENTPDPYRCLMPVRQYLDTLGAEQAVGTRKEGST